MTTGLCINEWNAHPESCSCIPIENKAASPDVPVRNEPFAELDQSPKTVSPDAAIFPLKDCKSSACRTSYVDVREVWPKSGRKLQTTPPRDLHRTLLCYSPSMLPSILQILTHVSRRRQSTKHVHRTDQPQLSRVRSLI
jgi:hypothetical protein